MPERMKRSIFSGTLRPWIVDLRVFVWLYVSLEWRMSVSCRTAQLDQYRGQAFRKVIVNVAEIIVERGAVKKSVGELLSCHDTGWKSHHFNLTVRNIITALRKAIEKLKKGLGKLCFAVRCTNIHKFTDLAAVSQKKGVGSLWMRCWLILQSLVFLSNLEISEVEEHLTSQCK